jgi:acylphosphatase
MLRSVDVVVRGRVQGVSFRAYAEDEAGRLGVTGWIRNEPDGSVAGHFEGEPEAVDALVAWCRSGPRLARVETVDVRESPAQRATTFDVRY